MWLRFRRFLERLRRGRQPAPWVRELSAEQRRVLRNNLESLTKPRQASRRAVNAGAPRP